MSIFGLTERRSTLANPSGFLTGLFGGRATDSGIVINEQNALTYTTVYAAVQVIAEAIGTLPMNLYRRRSDGGRDLVTDQPQSGLLAGSEVPGDPNEETGNAAFKSTVMGWVLTWGNGYAEIERNNAGAAIALHQLAPNRIVPRRRSQDPQTGRPDPNRRIEYYVTRTAQNSPYLLEQDTLEGATLIDRDDMWHMAGLGWDGIMGYSPIAMAREAVALGLSAQAYGARFFGNSGVPSGVLESPKQVKDPAKLRAEWKAAHGGAGQRGTAVLEEGVTYKNIGIPPEDSQFLQTRQFQRSEISGIYRVPPHMIGDLSRSTNNNIEHQGMDFVAYCLMSWLVRMEEQSTSKLLSPDQRKAGYFYRFDADELLRGDQEQRYRAYAIGRQWGWLNPNDVRLRERMNILPGKAGTTYLIPMNMVDANAPAPEPAVKPEADQLPPAVDPVLPVDPKADLAAEGTRAIAGTRLRGSLRALLLDAAKRCVHKETSAMRRAAAKPVTFAQAARAFYAEHGDQVRAVLMTPAASCAELLEVPFAAARDTVDQLAREQVARSMTELADPAVDVAAVAEKWEKERPGEMADQLLKGIGL